MFIAQSGVGSQNKIHTEAVVRNRKQFKVSAHFLTFHRSLELQAINRTMLHNGDARVGTLFKITNAPLHCPEVQWNEQKARSELIILSSSTFTTRHFTLTLDKFLSGFHMKLHFSIVSRSSLSHPFEFSDLPCYKCLDRTVMSLHRNHSGMFQGDKFYLLGAKEILEILFKQQNNLYRQKLRI